MRSSSASAPVAWWLGIAAGLLNVNFLLESLVGHSAPAATVVSDLARSGRPWSWVFRAGDVGSAVLLLALAALAWQAGRDRRWRVGVVLLGLFALSTLLAVVFPEQCAAAAAACRGGADHGGGDLLHDTISTLGTTCGVLSAGALAAALRRRADLRSLAVVHAAVFVLAGALGLGFIWAQTTGHVAWLGWPQRAQIVTLSAWYAAVGLSVARIANLRGARAP